MSPRRCVYLVRGQPCGRAAAGNPPLCRVHGEADAPSPINEILEQLVETSPVQGIVGKVNGLLDRVAASIDQASRGEWPKRQPRPQAPPGGQPPPRRPGGPRQAPPKSSPKDDPRVILGFAPGAKLTAKAVKDRKRTLAGIYHPDKGGSEEAMKKINTAAEALLKEIG